jgi:hypothetical protein
MSFASKLLNLSKTEVVPKEITYKGEKLDFFVKTLNAGEVEDIGERALKNKAKGKEGPGRFRSRMISAAVCDEKGDPLFSADVAAKLSNGLSKLLWDAVNEVNNFSEDDSEDEDVGESSPGTTGSD